VILLQDIPSVASHKESFEFIGLNQLFWTQAYSILAFRTDAEITPEIAHQLGVKKGIVFWAPKSITLRPKWWYRLPTIFAKMLQHSSRTAFSVLDTPDYWKKWSPKARNHRRKIRGLIEEWTLQLKWSDHLEEYISVYEKTPVPDPYKAYLLHWCRSVSSRPNQKIRILMAYIQGEPLAGAIFIDEGATSEYFTSFYHKDAKPYHLWIAIMDYWFQDSYEKWFKYADLDHMRDRGQSKSLQGYTTFKESIADYDVYFHDIWVRFF
jgi:hypothetical protein